mmetsp:Transcript_23399/g.40268  ORF Transcript_23399/g.40268 Transcript_23399/m.40268 type:complete len:82 (+) Transcript_23399:41-286(+)
MYYPPCAVAPLAVVAERVLLRPDNEADYFYGMFFDSVTDMFARTFNVKLLVASETPVDHIGRHSSCSLGWHSSPTWPHSIR